MSGLYWQEDNSHEDRRDVLKEQYLLSMTAQDWASAAEINEVYKYYEYGDLETEYGIVHQKRNDMCECMSCMNTVEMQLQEA